jgi:hypothetical protein
MYENNKTLAEAVQPIIRNIQHWATEKGLHEADPFRQFAKHIEESAEFRNAETNEDFFAELGDNVVTITILAMQHDLDVLDCFCSIIVIYHDGMTLGGWADLKAIELNGRIAEAMCKKDSRKLERSIGQYFAFLANEAEQGVPECKSDIKKCAEAAFNKIAGRTGKMVDGVFVKAEDLPEGA